MHATDWITVKFRGEDETWATFEIGGVKYIIWRLTTEGWDAITSATSQARVRLNNTTVAEVISARES